MRVFSRERLRLKIFKRRYKEIRKVTKKIVKANPIPLASVKTAVTPQAAAETSMPFILPNKGFSSAFKVGRKDPCPCGSGKKYKKCCG